ncbi:MAG TPA: phosphate signaling complex protein PhoU [Bryobacteraceae bacterium]|nr:phosphate signaling complex protein PhoU [Bryobacteraceae bacterium]
MHKLTIGITELQEKLSRMGAMARAAVVDSVEALLSGNMELVNRVLSGEETINRLEMEIDDQAIRLLALHQPVACDLRCITAIMKMNTDLERMGDLAANIARRAISLAEEPRAREFFDNIRRMGNCVSSMVSRCIESFLRRDGAMAKQILKDDDEADRFLVSITRELFHAMSHDASTLECAMELTLVARNLERIADHATNIAEDVMFLIYGVDVRHHMGKVA